MGHLIAKLYRHDLFNHSLFNEHKIVNNWVYELQKPHYVINHELKPLKPALCYKS